MLSFLPCDVLDEVFDLIESVSEGFSTYFYRQNNYELLCWQRDLLKVILSHDMSILYDRHPSQKMIFDGILPNSVDKNRCNRTSGVKPRMKLLFITVLARVHSPISTRSRIMVARSSEVCGFL